MLQCSTYLYTVLILIIYLHNKNFYFIFVRKYICDSFCLISKYYLGNVCIYLGMYTSRLLYKYQFSVKTKHVICFVILIIKACCCVFLFVLHSTKLCVPNRHQKTGTPINCTKVVDSQQQYIS